MRSEAERPWLLPFLRGVRPRPGMYLGHENVQLLWQYLAGYVQGRVDLGLSAFGAGEPDHLQGFTEWLRERHGHGRSTAGWYTMIEQLDSSERNISTFFREFETYLLAKGLNLDSVEPRLPKVPVLAHPEPDSGHKM